MYVADRFLKSCDMLNAEEWWPEELNPVLDCLRSFRDVKDATFGWDLVEGWEDRHIYHPVHVTAGVHKLSPWHVANCDLEDSHYLLPSE